jgi:hypothetical protein
MPATHNEFSTDLFSFKGGEFIAEASTLKGTGQELMVEMDLTNPKTGGKRRFALHKTHKRDMETTHWTFLCPQDPKLSLTIFND